MMDSNVLIREWDGPYGGVPPWNLIKPSDFNAAFDQAIKISTANIEQIANNKEPPTFKNTIVELEQAGKILLRISKLFEVYTSNLNLSPIPEIETIVMPKLSKQNDLIVHNKRLFQRIEMLQQSDKITTLSPVEQRLVREYYKIFLHQGAQLDVEAKKKLSRINSQLAKLSTHFKQNMLNDEQIIIDINDKKKLSGLPKNIINILSEATKQHVDKNNLSQKSTPRWIIKNTRSFMEPILTYSDDRTLRKKVWETYYNRCDNGDENDNKEIVSKILKLRSQRAKLLGYKTHADWQLKLQMAKTPQTATELMMQVWPKALEKFKENIRQIEVFAKERGINITIKPWDYRYYANKVIKDKYKTDLNEIKPYLQLGKIKEGMMWVANRLYELSFKQIFNLPVFHPDVEVWEVSRNKHHVGLWYFDPYERPGKISGAWMSCYRDQEAIDHPISAQVFNNLNLVKAGSNQSSTLLSWDEATTLFHEFGHALHGLCSACTYPSQSGTSVPSDYVEFPSLLNEYWLSTTEFLEKFAVHYETGEVIPEALFERIKKALKFDYNFSLVEYLACALVDMKLHSSDEEIIDPALFECQILKELKMPKEIVMRHRTTHFSHLFDPNMDYSATYYSYLWAAALAADTAEYFESSGSYYNKKVVSKFFDNVISVGNSVDPKEGFRQFRGRDVDIQALIRKFDHVTSSE